MYTPLNHRMLIQLKIYDIRRKNVLPAQHQRQFDQWYKDFGKLLMFVTNPLIRLVHKAIPPNIIELNGDATGY